MASFGSTLKIEFNLKICTFNIWIFKNIIPVYFLCLHIIRLIENEHHLEWAIEE